MKTTTEQAWYIQAGDPIKKYLRDNYHSFTNCYPKFQDECKDIYYATYECYRPEDQPDIVTFIIHKPTQEGENPMIRVMVEQPTQIMDYYKPKPETEKTIVEFYQERDEPHTPFAYFPEERFRQDSDTRTCYSHVGQHSDCSPEYVKECNRATPEQYKPLKQELESIGYNLIIQ